MNSLISISISVISLLLTIVIIVIYSIYFKKRVKKEYIVFEYDNTKTCYTQFKTINNKACLQNNSLNGNFFANLESKKLPLHYISTLYQIRTDTQDNLTNQHFWLTIYDKNKKSVIGSCRWSLVFRELKIKIVGRSSVPYKQGIVSSASGILDQYQNQIVLIDYTEPIRRIYLYTKNTFIPVFNSKKYKDYWR